MVKNRQLYQLNNLLIQYNASIFKMIVALIIVLYIDNMNALMLPKYDNRVFVCISSWTLKMFV